MKVDLDISPEDVGCDDEYSGYHITDINIHEDKKEIWSVSYSYSWHCGDGCCSDTNYSEAFLGDLSEWLKQWILQKLPGYHFQC
jgi:hypothetical protein